MSMVQPNKVFKININLSFKKLDSFKIVDCFAQLRKFVSYEENEVLWIWSLEPEI